MKRGGKWYKTRFKHGGIKISSDEDMLSIGLIFRCVTGKQQFDCKTGLVKLDNAFWKSLTEEKKNEYYRREQILNQFTSSGQLNDCHLHLKELFLQMSTKYF